MKCQALAVNTGIAFSTVIYMYGEESLSNFWRVTASYLQQQREGLVISRAVSQHNNHRRRQKGAAAHKTRGICRS